MSELQILFPEAEFVMLGKRRVRIKPVLLRDFELYGKCAAALIDLFSSASVQQINRYASTNSIDLRRLLLATTSLKRWQLWFVPSAVAVQLCAEVVRVNSGFFGEALPAVARALNGEQSSND